MKVLKRYKLFFQPIFLIIFWMLFLSTPLAGSLKYFYITRFDGGVTFIRKSLSLAEKLWIVLLILFAIAFGAWIRRYLSARSRRQDSIVISVIGISAVIAFLASTHFLHLESINYPNYIYSTFGLKISHLDVISTASLFVAVLCVFLPFIKMQKLKRGKKQVLKQNFLRGLLNPVRAIFLVGLVILIWQALSPFRYWEAYVGYSAQTYESKFEQFEYINKLSIHVPATEKIILPVQSSVWPAISNPPVVRYFLFPRELVSSSIIENQQNVQEISSAYFVELGLENDKKHWPDIDQESKVVSFNGEDKINYTSLELVSGNNGINIYFIVF